MSIRDRKARESSELRRKILGAALHVLAEEGYGRVSMRKIAARIDYSATTIYRFFGCKEDLLGAIAAETYGALSARFAQVRAERGKDPVDLLKALMEEYIRFCVEQPDMYRLYSDVGSFELEDGVLFERVGDTRAMVYQSWFGCIRQAIDSGCLEVDDALRVFLFLWDAVSGYIDHRINQPGIPRKALAEDSAEFLDLVFRGIERRNT